MKNLFRRLLGGSQSHTELPSLSSAAETVLVVEPSPIADDAINVDPLFFPWLLGAGTGEVRDLSEEEKRVLRALKRVTDANDPTVVDLVPRMPSVIPMLLQSLREKNVANTQLAEQITRDAVLVAAVLKQVNSAYYQRSTQISSIEQALMVMGQNGLRMLVASVAFKPLFNLRLGYLTTLAAPRVWDLSTQYGTACRHLSRQRRIDSFEAFLAGLLQNVGIIVALRIIDKAHLSQSEQLCSLAFFASFGHYARKLARMVGQQWEFPEHVIASIRDESSRPAAASDLAEVLRLADKAAKLRLLVLQGRLQEEDIDACLDGDYAEECMACYRELAADKSMKIDAGAA